MHRFEFIRGALAVASSLLAGYLVGTFCAWACDAGSLGVIASCAVWAFGLFLLYGMCSTLVLVIEEQLDDRTLSKVL